MDNIYGLIDPRDDILKYVGKTSSLLSVRLSQHIHEAKYTKKKTKKLDWIRFLLSNNLFPTIVLLEKTDNWEISEQNWIAKLNPEKNTHSGGLGWPKGKRLSEEHKKKIGESCRGKTLPPFSDEHRRKISIAMKNRGNSDINRKICSEQNERKYITCETEYRSSESYFVFQRENSTKETGRSIWN